MGIGHHHHHHDHSHPDHDHDHVHSHPKSSHGASTSLKAALLITAVFMVVEVSAGWWANSLALLGDGFHMATDIGSLLLSLFALSLAQRPSTPRMSFGYHRVEILGALTSGLAIWVIAGFLIYESIQRMASPPEVQGPVVLGVAALGLVANLISMKFLHQNRHENINVKAAYLHLLADSLGSVGAVVAGAVLTWTGWNPIDPLITVIFSVLMLFSSWELVKESIEVLLESSPRSLNPLEIRAALAALPGVDEVHDLHLWSVSSGRHALSAHLIARDGDQLLGEANQILLDRFGIRHTTLQIEHPEKFQSERCYDCTPSKTDASS